MASLCFANPGDGAGGLMSLDRFARAIPEQDISSARFRLASEVNCCRHRRHGGSRREIPTPAA
jgi:hypothetical protein